MSEKQTKDFGGSPLRTIVEAAAYLRVCKRTVEKMLAQGELMCTRNKRRVFIEVDQLEAFIRRSRVPGFLGGPETGPFPDDWDK